MEVINRVLGGELADKSNPAVDDIGVGDLSGLSTQRGLTSWETAKVRAESSRSDRSNSLEGKFCPFVRDFPISF